MSTISTTTPQWNAEVKSAVLGNGIALLSDDVTALNTKIQAFVQTSFFQNKLAELSKNAKAPFDIQLIFEDGAIKLSKKGSTEETLTLPASTSGTASTPDVTANAMEETTKLVKAMADYYLNTKTQKAPPTSTANNDSTLASLGHASKLTPKASDSTLTTYDLHGIQNPESKFCYANSAYQILANVPSLKTSVINPNDNLAYNQIKDGQTLVEAVNTFKTTDLFDLNKVYDASEVFEALINSNNSMFPPFTLETTEELSDITCADTIEITNPLITQLQTEDTQANKPRNERIFTCGIPSTDDINFKHIIASKLVQTSKVTKKTSAPAEIPPAKEIEVTYTKKTTTKFQSQPKQLLIQLDRKTVTTGATTTITLNDQFIEGIPMVLNLQEYDAIKATKKPPVPLELKGFTVHKGSDSSNGHYIAYFKKENSTKNGEYQWFCANDDRMLIVPETEVIKALGHAHNLYYDDTETSSIQTGTTPLVSYTKSLAKNSNSENVDSNDEDDKEEFHDADDDSSSPENATTSTNKPVVPIQAELNSSF